MIKLAIVDHVPASQSDSFWTATDLVNIAAAVTIQVQRDFAQAPPLGYGITATVRVGRDVGEHGEAVKLNWRYRYVVVIEYVATVAYALHLDRLSAALTRYGSRQVERCFTVQFDEE